MKLKSVTIRKGSKRMEGTIRLPFSKSISNRLLMLQAVSGKKFDLRNLSDAGDTLLLQRLLQETDAKKGSARPVLLDTQNAGTVMRFLTAYLAGVPGRWILDGSDRMKQRPIGILVGALRSLGADIEYLAKPDYPPLIVKGRPLKSGHVTMDPGVSSQFLSAILMTGCMLPEGLEVTLKGPAVSFPYVEMTLSLLSHFGVTVVRKGSSLRVPPCELRPSSYAVEPDWTSASFWYEAAALAGEADLLLPGLEKDSIQGDAILSAIFRDLGIATEFTPEGALLTGTGTCVSDFSFNFSDHPDIALPVITTCAALGIRGRFEGLKSLTVKETDRLAALRNEMRKMGVAIPVDLPGREDPFIEIPPVQMRNAPGTRIFTYGDHRMAMTFAMLALKTGSIVIESPDVVSKSYPGFWQDLVSVGFEIS